MTQNAIADRKGIPIAISKRPKLSTVAICREVTLHASTEEKRLRCYSLPPEGNRTIYLMCVNNILEEIDIENAKNYLRTVKLVEVF